ncbi:MAG: DUF6288 domain-containing protein [Verrucomicrobia bacterium]|nr:DUF6288 domain-containing protein [Verrucomicrobiota bacterium]
MRHPAFIVLTAVLLWIAPGTAWLHAAPAAAAGEAYYTEAQIYRSRPEPARDTPFGCIGATGLMARVYPGVTVKVEQMMPGSPAAGKFRKGEIITGINGVALKGHNPFVTLGNALTKAEASDGRMVFDVASADGKAERKETVSIPVLGANGKDGMIAAAMQIATDARGDVTIYQKARQYLAMSMLDSYPLLVMGHGDDGRGDGIWRGIITAYLMKEKPALYRQAMDRLTWWHDLSREPGGSIGIATLAWGNGKIGSSGPGMGLSYTAPLQTLRITGAPRSKHSKDFTLPANLWGTMADR